MRLPRSFFAQNTLSVARDLLGKVLVYRDFAGKIVETEAYLGPEDLASHARFKSSKRNHLMFGTAGHVYVYRTYGMYYMFNVIAKEDGNAGAVLIRALEPLLPHQEKMNGPGKWTKALHITTAYNGIDLAEGDLFIEDRSTPIPLIQTTPRIGIDYAGVYKNKPWRFLIKNPTQLLYAEMNSKIGF